MQVFVYGTLTDRERARTVLGPDWPSAEFIGDAVLEGCHRVDGRYPTLAPGGRTAGKLVCVAESGLDRFDRYEGVDQGLYVRVQVPRADADGAVWTYVGDPARLGVETTVGWPAGKSFRTRVRRYVARNELAVRPANDDRPPSV